MVDISGLVNVSDLNGISHCWVNLLNKCAAVLPSEQGNYSRKAVYTKYVHLMSKFVL